MRRRVSRNPVWSIRTENPTLERTDKMDFAETETDNTWLPGQCELAHTCRKHRSEKTFLVIDIPAYTECTMETEMF